jgi:hypothetical protein
MDKKNIIIICLVVALAVVSWIAFKQPPPPYDDTLIKSETKRLQRSNDSLMAHIGIITVDNARRDRKIDSLESLKPKIITKYDTIYKRIDNANSVSIANEFTSVFADANVK